MTTTYQPTPWTDHVLPPPDDPVDALHEVADYQIECAHHDGYQQACEDIAAGHAELAAVWRATGRPGYEQRVAQRIAAMAAVAARDHALYGTTEWAGLEHGAELPTADWDTSTPTTIAMGRAA